MVSVQRNCSLLEPATWYAVPRHKGTSSPRQGRVAASEKRSARASTCLTGRGTWGPAKDSQESVCDGRSFRAGGLVEREPVDCNFGHRKKHLRRLHGGLGGERRSCPESLAEGGRTAG